jgi:hypothetical protein
MGYGKCMHFFLGNIEAREELKYTSENGGIILKIL